MQRINSEYDDLWKIYRNVHKTAEGNTYSKHEENSNDVPDRFKEIINAIIGFRCKIEICGSWIWVFNAYPYRKQLKASVSSGAVKSRLGLGRKNRTKTVINSRSMKYDGCMALP